MKADRVNRILILDQGNPVSTQLHAKAAQLFQSADLNPEIVILKVHRAHNIALEIMEETIRSEKPQLVLIGATALGEEVAPALGIRFETGVAAHCVDIKISEDGRLAYMVPAFGGKVIGEIFIPDADSDHPAIATVKPGTFSVEATDYPARIIDIDAAIEARQMQAGKKQQGDFRMAGIEKRDHSAGSIGKAELIFCGGFGLGSEENWKKLETLAQRFGGGAGCTRAALDAGWGCSEDSMIGTSGQNVRPKVYVGFGISGAAHHTCGIKDSDTIISINSDRNAEVFVSSDYKGVFDAEAVIDALLKETER